MTPELAPIYAEQAAPWEPSGKPVFPPAALRINSDPSTRFADSLLPQRADSPARLHCVPPSAALNNIRGFGSHQILVCEKRVKEGMDVAEAAKRGGFSVEELQRWMNRK